MSTKFLKKNKIILIISFVHHDAPEKEPNMLLNRNYTFNFFCLFRCSVGAGNHSRYRPPGRVVIWPPPSSSSSSSRHFRLDLSNATENPVLGSKMQLYSRTGHHLAVYPDGKVLGTPDENDLHSK